MTIKRVTITPDGDEVPLKGDRIVEILKSPNEGEGFWVVVEREVPDPPKYKPGDMGTATVENEYGSAFPNKRGVWVATGDRLYFRLLEAKHGVTAAYPERRVSDFLPESGVPETVARLTMELDAAKTKDASTQRRLDRAEKALSELVRDLNLIRSNYGTREGITLNTWTMHTSAGATMLTWLARRLQPRVPDVNDIRASINDRYNHWIDIDSNKNQFLDEAALVVRDLIVKEARG